MLSELEGAAGESLVTESEGVLGEEMSGGRDGASCPGDGVVPVVKDALRVAMADGGVLGVHFSLTARTLWGKHKEGSAMRWQRRHPTGQVTLQILWPLFPEHQTQEPSCQLEASL